MAIVIPSSFAIHIYWIIGTGIWTLLIFMFYGFPSRDHFIKFWYKRVYINALFFDDTKGLDIVPIIPQGYKFEFEDGSYYMNNDAVVYHDRIPCFIYKKGHSSPIKVDIKDSINGKPVIPATLTNSLVFSDILHAIFSRKDQLKKLEYGIILIGIILVLFGLEYFDIINLSGK